MTQKFIATLHYCKLSDQLRILSDSQLLQSAPHRTRDEVLYFRPIICREVVSTRGLKYEEASLRYLEYPDQRRH